MRFLSYEGLEYLYGKILAHLNKKVDKEDGKGLSSNDFTDTLLAKLNGIAAEANKYTHPGSGVTAGTYRSVTVDAQGHVTKGSNPTTLSGYGITDAAGKEHAHDYAGSSSAGGAATSAVKLATARKLNGLSFDGTADRANYGACSTAAATAAKTVACAGFTLVNGAEIIVKFTVTNTAANPTLNVNGTGAKPVYYRGAAISAGSLAANRTYAFRYNGTQYELVGDLNSNTTYGLATESQNGLMSAADFSKLAAFGDADTYMKKGAVTWDDLGGS